MRTNQVIATLALIVTALLTSSCEKYDDTDVWKKIYELDSRITIIENTLRSLNTDIGSIRSLVETLQGKITITSITEVDGGFRIVFSNGRSYTIRNGNDGDVPHIGSNGNWWIGNTDTRTPARGTDGETPYIGSNGNWWIGNKDLGVSATGGANDVPIIGIKEYNGVWYWTRSINGKTEWLTDGNGNKIPVSGNDGTTPILQVSADGYWMISYNNGIKFDYILDENGNKVKAQCDCTSYFRSVTYNDGILTLVLMDGTVLTIPVEETTGIDAVLPDEIQQRLGQYMPLYSGSTPPKADGSWRISPLVVVYCEDGYNPESLFPITVLFYNQNNDTLDIYYEELDDGVNYQYGGKGFIMGSGSNFTAGFSSTGSSYGISFKTALIISGTISESGSIKNLYYAFVMVEKDADPENILMDEGICRIFKDGDGNSEQYPWSLGIAEPQSIDLGLPSGLKWASFNTGATAPEEYGYFYAWGEILRKLDYSWSTYKWCNGTSQGLTKYITSTGYGTIDNMTELDSDDDVAFQLTPGKDNWRMPSTKDFEEILDSNNCSWTWTSQNGANGYVVKSKRNGNSIFLPCGGYTKGTSVLQRNVYGDYWAADLYVSDNSYGSILEFSKSQKTITRADRSYGLTIRPVCD